MRVDEKTIFTSHSAFHFVIFKEDKIMAFFEDGKWLAAMTELSYSSGGTYSYQYSIEIGPGDYALAIFGVGDVGGGYLAAKELYISGTKLAARVELAAMTSSDVTEKLLQIFDGDGNLSETQCQELISFMNLKCKYWLENATGDVKKTLNINGH